MKKPMLATLLLFSAAFLFGQPADPPDAALLLARAEAPKANWGQLRMLEGTRWQYQADTKTKLFQTWEQTDETTFVGCNFTVLGTDTTVLETMHLEKKGREIRFIPNLWAAKPTVFLLSSYKENTFLFENPSGDFPQKATIHRDGRKEYSLTFYSFLLGVESKAAFYFHP